MAEKPLQVEAAIVGAGPIGLETAVELQRAGIQTVNLDKGPLASTILWFPRGMTFFSSTDRLEIAGMPIQTPHQTKCTREAYLAYLRSVVLAFDLRIESHEAVTGIRKHAGAFHLTTRRPAGERTWVAQHVVLATGDMDRPRRLGVAGEGLPHVSHYFHEPHPFFQKRVLIVGGKNSAVEAALRCHHAGARVSLSYRRQELDPHRVKYWLLPELKGRIARGEIAFCPATTVHSITPTHVHLVPAEEQGPTSALEADFVLLMTGYEADTTLLEAVGVELNGPSRSPRYDEQTMETRVPGLYVAGTTTAGTQQSFSIFIENCHIHAKRIAAAITGASPPPPPPPLEQLES